MNTLPRNHRLYDTWSLVHFATGVVMGWVMNPLAAFVIMALWEPLEILILSPLLARRGIIFGHESWRNSLSDIVVDLAGVAVGTIFLAALIKPPFYWF